MILFPMSNDPYTKRFQTVMIIEDDPKVTKLLEHGLSEEGRKVYAVYSCEDAFGLIDRGVVPEVIVLDLTLPGMSGMDFLKMIKDRYPHLKTVVISAKGDVETVVEALNLGALDYIHKPFSIDELQIAVDKAMSHKEMAEELERLKRQELFTEDYSIIYASSEMANIMATVSQVSLRQSRTVPSYDFEANTYPSGEKQILKIRLVWPSNT